jgi:hypothetical protein
MTTETLDDRVRRLTQILAARGRDIETNSHEPQAVAALKHFSTSLGLLQQLTAEVRSRIGADEWDASDALAARLLLDALVSAVRSCRVVSHVTASSLVEVERTVKKFRHFIHREEVTRR